MIDLSLKQEIEKEGKLQDERFKRIKKEFESFVDEMIEKEALLSMELLQILNELQYREITARVVNIVQTKAKQNIMLRNQIMNGERKN